MLNLKKPTQDSISFDPLPHTYTGSRNILYTPVTTVIGLYNEPYDTPFWTLYKGMEQYYNIIGKPRLFYAFKAKLRALKQAGGTAQDKRDLLNKLFNSLPGKDNLKVLEYTEAFRVAWAKNSEEKSAKGTDYHDKAERKTHYNGYDYIAGKRVIYTEQHNWDLSKLDDGFRTELLVYHNGVWISGKVDKSYIETIGSNRYVDIDDYKTNEKVDKDNKYGDKMLYPLRHLDSCKWNTYKLQISLYAWILEQWGFIPRNLSLTRVTDTKIWIEPFEYMKKEVELMLHDFTSKK